jgi:branched-chain amino acid transport system ATP-binding protein
VGYARKGLALDKVSLTVPKGSIVALLGANGAGKTTLIRAISGLLSLHHGEVKGGGIEFEGQSILGVPSHRLVRMGMAQVPEGRLVFKQLTVEENLAVGAAILPRSAVKERMDAVYALFPRLLERRTQAAGMLSGGEQQMLALGRALVAKPRLLLVDELSLGLAPLIVEAIYKQLIVVGATLGTSMLIVEQNARSRSSSPRRRSCWTAGASCSPAPPRRSPRATRCMSLSRCEGKARPWSRGRR